MILVEGGIKDFKNISKGIKEKLEKNNFWIYLSMVKPPHWKVAEGLYKYL
jgi:hypothetical protein